MTPHRIGILLALSIAGISPAVAQSSLCGAAPRTEDVSIKAELDGKASLLTKYLGDAGLKGQVEIAKNDVLQKYPNADELRLKQQFLYTLCLIIMNATTLDDRQKLDALDGVRHGIFPPKSEWEELRKEHAYIDQFELHDRVLAASAIMVDACNNRTLWSSDVRRAFKINQAVFESALRKLHGRRMIAQLRDKPNAVKFFGEGIVTYQLTDRAYDYVAKRNLVK
jgi:hypothetical protein